ncbi:MAG: putative dehydrogenase [Patiriisocius sp.]|jgi:predicted dehydrogenase
MLKIAVIGAGHLGKIHLKILANMPEFELVGFYDANEEVVKTVEKEMDIRSFGSIPELIDAADVVDVVTPTLSHFDCAQKALTKNKHVFIEKPLTKTVGEAEELIKLNKNSSVKVQVGHVERFNPAFTSVVNELGSPMFIETHRLAQFNPRGTDVSVVLDLMIHDLDIILSVVKNKVSKVSASGVAVLSDTPDIANARIEFENGCVANLTASRISMKNMRKSRFFQGNAYISVDFLERKSEVVSMKDVVGEPDPFAITIEPGNGKPAKEISFSKPKIEANNAIEDELRAFHEAITKDTTPIVSITDGFEALKLAHEIVKLIEQ